MNEMLRTRLFLIFALTILVTSIPECCGYRILGIFPLNARSHMMMFEQLMKGLARRGHQVDVISTFPQNKPYPNYTDIVIPSATPKLDNRMTYDDLVQFNAFNYITLELGNNVCEKGFAYPAIQKLINNPPNDPPYDLVITEILGAHCFMIFGRHLNVPVIGLSASTPYPWMNDYVANPENLAFVPNNFMGSMDNKKFSDRLYNFIYNIYAKLYFNYRTTPQNDIIKSHFGTASPSVRELERDVALILVNSHMSLNGIKPTTPALVEVGGLHIQADDSGIPKEHKKWLDESKDGFIYFSFGEMMTIESFPKTILDNMFKSFQKLAPIRIFMKVRRPELLPSGLPKNVRTFVWIPQIEVLKHQNIRAFITHGGRMSTQEAISCAVPMIGIPLFTDQFTTIGFFVMNKIAVRVDYRDLTTAVFDVALNEVLHNPIYRQMAREVSMKFLDRPLNPLDEACFWIEYVIRHGSKALRSPALDFSWWQIALLDVYLILIIAGIGAILILFALFKFLIDIVHGRSSRVSHDKKFN